MSNTSEGLLTIKQASEYSGLPVWRLRELYRTDRLARIQFCKNGLVFFRRSDIDKALERSTLGAREAS